MTFFRPRWDGFNRPRRWLAPTAPAAPHAKAGVVLRKSDTSNYVRAYVDYGASMVYLDKVITGVATNLASAAWPAASTAELRAMAQGDRFRVWADRKLVIDVTDANALRDNTKAGMFYAGATATTGDDFYAEGL